MATTNKVIKNCGMFNPERWQDIFLLGIIRTFFSNYLILNKSMTNFYEVKYLFFDIVEQVIIFSFLISYNNSIAFINLTLTQKNSSDMIVRSTSSRLNVLACA
jgi:hypothetical protein